MAIEKGFNGLIMIGANAIGEMFEYELSNRVTFEDTTPVGQTARRVTPMLEESSGRVTAYLDDSDTAQAAMTMGASVTLLHRPEGTGSGNPQRSVAATITEINEPLSSKAVNRVTFSWEGGTVDRTAQA